ncbi:MAG: hypothetical protein ACE5E1_10160 [Phycisphaerae bacterium]
MMPRRYLLGAFVVSLLFVGPLVRAEDETPATEKLTRAIKLFNSGDYEASRDMLLEAKEQGLESDDDRIQLQRYLSLTKSAIAGLEEAKRALSEGRAALGEKKLEAAKRHFEAVTGNPFSSAAMRAEARAALGRIAAQSAPRPAPKLSAETRRAVGQSSLVDQLAREHALLWQKAVATYKATAVKIRKAILDQDFAEADRLMDFARQTIELNRRHASPASKYEDLRRQALDLEVYIEDEKKLYDEEQARIQRDELAKAEAARIAQINQSKQRQIDSLMARAEELRKEQRLDEAIQVLGQVIAIDRNNEQAKWMRETLEDLEINIRDNKVVRDRGTQAQDLFVETDEAGIPWHENITYPKDWPEITATRTGTAEAGESPENRQVREKLKRIAPEIRFDATPFEEVIDKLRALTGLNIVPNWSALEAAAVEKDAEVTLRLSNVKFEKALQLILDDVGAGEVDLAYEISGGVISISTKDDLSRRTVTKVYNVQDLLITVPTFRGRRINLQNIGQTGGQQGGLGGGRFVGQGGGGGGGGGNNGGLFDDNGDQDDDNLGDDTDPLQPIIELIQQTIDPESWREAGGNVGSISALQQQLIVTQTSTAQAELRDLLKQLRQARALQIAVETRYITISRNWAEQIGVDLDVVLNNGNAGFDRTTILEPATNNPILVPRRFTRHGFTPGAPGGVGIALPTQPFGQPFGQPGLVPGTGTIGPHSGRFTPVPVVNNTIDLAAPANTNIAGSLGSLVNSTPAFQIFGSFLDNIQVDFLLRATQVDKRTSDLDAPRLVLFNGQRATFEAFIEQDYIAALTPVIGDNAGAFLPQVDTALTGRSLDVQATVSADRRYVTMTVRTFTRVTGDFRTVFFGGSQTVGSGFIELATQTTQQIRTTVSVPDGGTLLIGGLKLSGERDVDAGVPILSRIPILKRAFSNTSNVKDDQILLILIRPTIIIQEEAEAKAFPTLSSLGGSGF